MVLVNDNWEQVNNFEDISNIIREHYNYDLADELDKLIRTIPEHPDWEYYEVKYDLEEVEWAFSELIDENKFLKEKIHRLEDKIKELKYIKLPLQ